MTSFPPIFILRHGQTEWNLQRRCQGQLNSNLTALGRSQASNQGVLLQNVFIEHPNAQIICSPQGRARETAKIALTGLNLAIHYDPRVAEVGAGAWSGMSHALINAKWPMLFNENLTIFEASLNAVDGEGYQALQTRCLGFLKGVTGPIVVFTHGITSMVLRGLICGLSYDETAQLPFTQGCIFALIEGKEIILTR